MKEKGRKAAKFIAEMCMRLKAGEHFLVISDDLVRPRWMAELLSEAGNSLGAEATLVIMSPRIVGQLEPPPEVGGAMKVAVPLSTFLVEAPPYSIPMQPRKPLPLVQDSTLSSGSPRISLYGSYRSLTWSRWPNVLRRWLVFWKRLPI